MTRAAVVALLLALAVAGEAADRDSWVLEGWHKRMVKTVDALKAGDHRAALRLANGTVNDMVDKLGPGDGAMQWFIVAVTHKALAHAGLGEKEEALWYWHAVLSMNPRLADSDLGPFGAAGEFLKQNIQPVIEESRPLRLDASLTPPKLVKRVNPKFPQGAQTFGVGGALVLEVIITPDGRLQAPRVIKPLPAPTLSYAAIDAVRRWRFEPAKADGKPVCVIFNLTVNYKP